MWPNNQQVDSQMAAAAAAAAATRRTGLNGRRERVGNEARSVMVVDRTRDTGGDGDGVREGGEGDEV